ncbi:MAG: branched-chain amino acid ABC transporter permease [Spirochaetes bacterium]|nr:branched-chain amino acid ABC transporter permease [Spirochaetota bacterium]
MSVTQIWQYVLTGISMGSIYVMVAIGYNIIYNTTGIINFAQGEFLMLGAMIAISLSTVMPLIMALVLAIVLTTIIGALMEFFFIRHMKKPTVLNMIIITIGLSIMIREAALHIWDEKVHSLAYFTGNELSSINILGAYVSPQYLWVLGMSALIIIGLNIFFKHTTLGRAMRACSSNKKAAWLCGINVKNMVTISFMLSAAIGALAGCVISPITQTQYDGGTSLAIKGFTVAILGGLGNNNGALAGGLILGVLENLSIIFLPLAYKDALSLTILVIILAIKPSGLFVKKVMSSLKEY